MNNSIDSIKDRFLNSATILLNNYNIIGSGDDKLDGEILNRLKRYALVLFGSADNTVKSLINFLTSHDLDFSGPNTFAQIHFDADDDYNSIDNISYGITTKLEFSLRGTCTWTWYKDRQTSIDGIKVFLWIDFNTEAAQNPTKHGFLNYLANPSFDLATCPNWPVSLNAGVSYKGDVDDNRARHFSLVLSPGRSLLDFWSELAEKFISEIIASSSR